MLEKYNIETIDYDELGFTKRALINAINRTQTEFKQTKTDMQRQFMKSKYDTTVIKYKYINEILDTKPNTQKTLNKIYAKHGGDEDGEEEEEVVMVKQRKATTSKVLIKISKKNMDSIDGEKQIGRASCRERV